MEHPIRPIRFCPLLERKLWGGNQIAALKGLTDYERRIGESFEVSALRGEATPESEGDDVGLNIPELIGKYGARLVGKNNMERYGTQFPLLIKIIDARSDLSIQVHPDDEMARTEGMPYGKSEMWFVVKATPGASIVNGFCRDVDDAYFEHMLADGSLTAHLNCFETHPGDAFYIPAGRIHSIGAGNLLVEVQQSSGATYRVYDFDRTDENGKRRELHVGKARRALNFEKTADGRISYRNAMNERVAVKQSPYFSTHVYHLTELFEQDFSAIDSFVIMVAYEGSALLTDGAGHTLPIKAGQTVMFPAENNSVTFRPTSPCFSCFEATIEN